jgi:hypothetical protein
MRYILMSLYAFFEDEVSIVRLHKKFHNEASVHMLLPVVALYYKQDNYKKAESYLKKLGKVSGALSEVFSAAGLPGSTAADAVAEYGIYQRGSKEEILVALTDSAFLYEATQGLFAWMAKRVGTPAERSEK